MNDGRPIPTITESAGKKPEGTETTNVVIKKAARVSSCV